LFKHLIIYYFSYIYYNLSTSYFSGVTLSNIEACGETRDL